MNLLRSLKGSPSATRFSQQLSITVLLTLVSITFCGCATMIKGTTDDITVISDPPGATVSANDSFKGTTPVNFTVRSKEDIRIQVSKAGYETRQLEDDAHFRWGLEVWAFIAYVIPMVVDLADGAAWGHDSLTMTAHLEPIAQDAPPVAIPQARSRGR